MSRPVISVENISKSYQLGVIGTGTFRGDVQRWWAKLRGQPDPHLKIGEKDHGNRDGETVWALKDINFQVQQGEALGIIGRNGAGKSTLLKILSRVTAPTSGVIKTKGKIASLLEVGTGFHPELTGRENIFMNGAIFGMSRKEITRKFDEIVDFSGVETYIETPVKRYSSGMYVRLAFAVAAHLEPEILVVDEVLAVGDAAFQKKCLGKMGDVAKQGRTVLFVSHNMAAINNLCQEAILLTSGRISEIGFVSDVVNSYLATMESGDEKSLDERKDRKGDGRLFVNKVLLADGQGNLVQSLVSGQDSQIILSYSIPNRDRLRNISITLALESMWGQRLCTLQTDFIGQNFEDIGTSGKFICSIPHFPLAAGRYLLTYYITSNNMIVDWVQSAGRIHVEASDYYGHGKFPDAQDGPLLIKHNWMCSHEN